MGDRDSYSDFTHSADGGQTWTNLTASLAQVSITSFALDPSAPSTLFINGYGLHRSGDGGATWTPAAGGLFFASPGPIAVSPVDPLLVYLGTVDSGLFVSATGGQ